MELILYLGTSSLFPFPKFEKSVRNRSLVSGGRYQGYFFTSSKDNAEFYSELWVAKVSIRGAEITDITIPKLALEKANKDNRIYILEDILDGSHFSDIVVVVPDSLVNHIKILSWETRFDSDTVFEVWDEFFDSEDDVEEILEISGYDYSYLEKMPMFRGYIQKRVENFD